MQSADEILVCAYCEAEFETEHERGVHISDNHVSSEDKYSKEPEADRDPYVNIVDEWKKRSEGLRNRE